MKYWFTLICWLPGLFCAAQSPAYNIVFQLKDTLTPFQIDMKFCKPNNPTESKGWFSHDTSGIIWKKLTAADYTCGRYFESETFDKPGKNSFKTSNQAMVWENVLVFRIIKKSERRPMYLIVPVFIKSFVTSVSIKNVSFKPGIYELDKLSTTINGMRITMKNTEGKMFPAAEKKRVYNVDLK